MTNKEKMQGVEYLAIVVLGFGLFYYNLTDEVSDLTWFRATALQHLLQAILSYSMAKKLHSNLLVIITNLVVLFCISNYLDELWFNPLKTQLNEVIFGIFSVLIIYYKNAKYINSNILRNFRLFKKG